MDNGEQTTITAPKRPVLRYHGGKWNLAEWIIANMPPHRVYVEPFGGAASVLMQKPRSYAEVYNDLDGEVVNIFRVLRDPEQARRLEDLLRLTPFARDEYEIAYQPVDDPLEMARRTVVRAFMGFGSAAVTVRRSVRSKDAWNTPGTGFRANSNRSGTTPAHDWANFPKEIQAFCLRLQAVVIENRPAIDVITQHDSEQTLFYCDPPYPLSTRDAGADYVHELTDADHRALSATLHGVAGMVLLSGYQCEMYTALYADWPHVTKAARADGARARTEVLWMNPAAASRAQRSLFGGEE